MSEITLNARKKSFKELVVNLTGEGHKVSTYRYEVERISGGAAAQMQIDQAEFARDEDRATIVGSLAFKRVVGLTKPKDGAPEFMALLDLVNDEQMVPLFEAVMAAATSSTVEG